jgi:hypothetical protein
MTKAYLIAFFCASQQELQVSQRKFGNCDRNCIKKPREMPKN